MEYVVQPATEFVDDDLRVALHESLVGDMHKAAEVLSRLVLNIYAF